MTDFFTGIRGGGGFLIYTTITKSPSPVSPQEFPVSQGWKSKKNDTYLKKFDFTINCRLFFSMYQLDSRFLYKSISYFTSGIL
jgi:hypothetical protein